MDYEDNDFQSQSFQLAVEENINFSPESHSYSLPKFDLDDNLQVHLRFGSLVESEDLLGIRSQEGNQWIEDFSRESSGLEFSSSAAESCTISRRNNVWSEATSSESVDLLLKSVGQDEMILSRAIIEESDNCDGLDSLMNQNNSSLNQVGASASKMENSACVPTSDEHIEQFSGKDLVDQQPQIYSTPQNDELGCILRNDSCTVTGLEEGIDVLTTPEENSACVPTPDEHGEQFSGKDLVDQQPQIDSISQNDELGCLLRNDSRTVTGLEEGIDVLTTPEENKSFNDSASPQCGQVNPSATSTQSLANAGELNNCVPQRAKVLEKDDAQIVGANQAQSRALNSQTCEGHLDDTNGNDVGNLSSLGKKVDPVKHISDLSSDAIFTQHADKIIEYEHSAFGNLQEASFFMDEGHNTFVAHSAAFSSSVTDVLSMQIIHNSDQTKGSCHVEVVDKQENLLENLDNELDEGTSVSNTERLLVKEKTGSCNHANKNSSDQVEHSSNLVVEMCSSSDIHHESLKHEDIKNRNEDSVRVHAAEAGSSSSLLAESQKRCDQLLIESGSCVYVCSPDTSVLEKKAVSFPTDSETAGVVSKIVNTTSDKLSDSVNNSILTSKIAMDETIPHEESESPSHIHSSCLVKQEETSTIISSLDAKQSSQVPQECSSSSSLVESQQTCDQTLIESGSSFVHLCSQDASVPEKVGIFPADSVSINVVPTAVNGASDNILDSVDNLLLQSNIVTDEAIQLKENPNSPKHVHNSCLVNEEKPVTVISNLDAKGSPQISHGRSSSRLPVVSQQRCDQILETFTNVVNICQTDAFVSEKKAGRFVTDSDEALHCKEYSHSISPAHASHMVQQEEAATALDLDLKPSSQVSDECVPIPSLESKYGEASDSCKEMPMDGVGQSSSSMETSAKMCQDVPESNVADVGSGQQCSTGLEEYSVIHDIDLKGKECVELCKKYDNEGVPIEAEGKGPIHDKETSGQSSPSTLRESSRDIGVKDPDSEMNKCTSTVHAGREGLSQSGCNSTLGPAIASQCRVIEVESNSLHPNESNCGSPTVISCTEASQSEEHQERNMGSLNHIDSGALKQDAKEVGHGASHPKEKDAFHDDGSFTFKVTSLVNRPENESEDGWNPFPTVQEYKIQQAQGSSGTPASGFFDIESKMSEDVAHESLQVCAETDRCASFQCDSVDKEMAMTEKTSERGTAKERRPENDKLLNGENENQESVRRLDSNTVVSGSMEKAVSCEVSTIHDPKENITAEIDKKVVFEVNQITNLSKEETCRKWKPVHNVQSRDILQKMVGMSPNAKAIQEVCHEGSPQTSSAMDASQSYKGSAVGRTKSSGKAAVKGNNKEGKVRKKTISTKHAKAGGTSPASQIVKTGEVLGVGYTKGNSIKSSVIATGQASNLPDLNCLTSPYTFLHQPFTDFQQLQLRAQIFVYGSIIQGATPDEACMLAAFGESDGGKRTWENVWRIAVERFQNQKSPLSNAKTPVNPHSGARATAIHGSEAVCTPGGAESNKFSSMVFNRNMPFSSPIWTTSTPCRDGSLSGSISKGPHVDTSKKFLPVQNSQPPHLRHYLGNTTPWMTQVPSPGAWVVTQKAAVDASVQHNTLPICETVRVTSIRESSAPHGSVKHYAPPNPLIHTVSPSSGVAGKSLAKVAKRTVSPTKHSSSESKPRKKRKNVALEESSQISSLAQPWRTPASVTTQSPTSVATNSMTYPMNNGSGNHISGISPVTFEMNVTAQPTYVATTTVTSAVNVASGVSVSSSPLSSVMNTTEKSPTSVNTTTMDSTVHFASGSLFLGNSSRSSTHGQTLGGGETELRVMSAEEMCSRIEQAKRHAEDAAALAASAVQHCQNIWSRLADQKKSGVVSGHEAKLESSAVAIAAAASVSKAAAAVAKVASDAALQAKLMADEAFVTSNSGDLTEVSFHNDVNKLGTLSPILKGRDQNNNADSVLVAAREAANKRVEAASAAAKRAENLDSVLKAAEMTAEAVSQAGAIIAMGEPLPFTLAELVDAGPEDYWKVQKKSSEQLVKSNNTPTEQIHKDGVKMGGVASVVELNELSNNNEANTFEIVLESQIVSETTSIAIEKNKYEGQESLKTSNGYNFVDGSIVEVRSDKEDLRTVWFSAKVLSTKDGKVLVSYGEHARNEGSSHSTEWVTVGSIGGNAPRIRIPHPMSLIIHDKMKKRSRTARGDYMWSVGDKVDACIKNGWWEGIVTEKSKEDETSFTIQFPVQQETSVVKAWNIRPSLIWENGKWVEWCRPVESTCLSHEGKPPKKGRLECETVPAVEAIGKEMTKIPSIMGVRKPETHKPLILSTNEKVFNVGKSTTKDGLGRKLTGLHKEGSKVNLDASKPGKKRKFMDVSKVSKTISKIGKPLSSTSFPSRVNASDSIPSKKKSPSDVVANVHSKGKPAPLNEKFVKNNEKGSGRDYAGNFTPSSVEPRRSVRKIQPTSRLLEGLQSSLIISRMPSTFHDKSTKTQHRNNKRA